MVMGNHVSGKRLGGLVVVGERGCDAERSMDEEDAEELTRQRMAEAFMEAVMTNDEDEELQGQDKFILKNAINRQIKLQ